MATRQKKLALIDVGMGTMAMAGSLHRQTQWNGHARATWKRVTVSRSPCFDALSLH